MYLKVEVSKNFSEILRSVVRLGEAYFLLSLGIPFVVRDQVPLIYIEILLIKTYPAIFEWYF